MSRSITFTQSEKAAIMCLVIEMVNVDDEVAYEELLATNVAMRALGVDRETFTMAHALKFEHAIAVVAAMTPRHKIAVGKLLTQIIDADGNVADSELHLLARIARATGLDRLVAP